MNPLVMVEPELPILFPTVSASAFTNACLTSIRCLFSEARHQVSPSSYSNLHIIGVVNYAYCISQVYQPRLSSRWICKACYYGQNTCFGQEATLNQRFLHPAEAGNNKASVSASKSPSRRVYARQKEAHPILAYSQW